MSDSLLMAELLEEICQRLEAGESVDMHLYADKHPELASQLEQLVPAMTVLGELSQSADTASKSQESPTPNYPPLGDYRLVGQIGRGGMGVVYEAEQMSLARRVAVKILPFASLWTERALDRFRNEVRIAAMLEHPNIVPIYVMGCERGVYFYAMKMVDGCSLSDVIRLRQATIHPIHPINPIKPISPTNADTVVASVTTTVIGNDNWYDASARLGQAAASALAFAHQQGVIHRDIKPSNLLLDRQGRLFVADFGLARLETDVSLTRTGDLLGTPRYMSPEQASGSSKQLDPRTDIYSLGATLYELLTLRPVISGPSRAAAIRQLQDLQVAAPRTHDANLPKPLEQIVLKCLRPDPSDRYATAGALVEDLGRYLAGQPVLARAPGVVRRTSRLIQRHPQATLGLLTVLILCSLISTVSFWMTHQGWLGSSPQRGPPSGELVDKDKLTTIPPNFQSPEESPDMPRTSSTKNTNIPSNKRRLLLEQLEPRTLFAQLAFGAPVNLGTGVNSFDHEEGATVTADGLNLMFFRYVNGANGPALGIFEATRNLSTEAFGNALSAGSSVNSAGGGAASHPDISPDGLTLLFSDDMGSGIFEATRSTRNVPFSSVRNIGISDLLPGQKCIQPTISSNGLTLYFSAYDTANSQNDIYQATRASTSDPWGNVIKLGPEINTTGYNDAQPSISADGLMLFFNSSRPGGFGSGDLYVSTRSSVNASWGNAVNLGPQVNTPYDEKGPFVSVDGSQLYYVSARPGGIGGLDLYQVPILGTAGETKFYVVDDASTDRTYEYQANGIGIEGYALTSGNSAPRGAASTVAGDKVWVVDASRRVYVYNTAGGSLGSWSAGSLNTAAQVEGIATNGTDIWIVDAKQDKVFKYTGAAGRTEYSQNAASSFNLNSGNSNPKDIVTDGTHLYVVNDSTTDKVFKYTLTGTLVSSWTVSTSGATSPTGITLDPSNDPLNPHHLWIVDNGTDRVYQYSNSVNQANGSSKVADASFSLATAAGNTNPQGIADPPPNSGLSTAPASIVRNSAFMQAPIVSFGVLSTERVASLQSGLVVAESVDEFMSQLARLLPFAPISVSKVPSTPVLSRTRFTKDQSIDLALADEEQNDSLHAIANDLLDSTLR